VADGLAPATVQATVIPLKAIFRREVEFDRVKVNPTVGLRLPAVRSRRDRIADPQEAARLLAAVPDDDRAVWATATYAGLRLGELRALRVRCIDLDAGVVDVECGWDQFEGEIETKGRNRRRVPIPAVLREHLAAHLLRTGRRTRPAALAFGETDVSPFEPQGLRDRADAAWEAAGLDRIKLHECRHTFASLMIAAGVNAKALCDYMGHSSIQVTYDKYGHLMPGNEGQAADLLDIYLARSTKAG
jgi:integrase